MSPPAPTVDPARIRVVALGASLPEHPTWEAFSAPTFEGVPPAVWAGAQVVVTDRPLPAAVAWQHPTLVPVAPSAATPQAIARAARLSQRLANPLAAAAIEAIEYQPGMSSQQLDVEQAFVDARTADDLVAAARLADAIPDLRRLGVHLVNSLVFGQHRKVTSMVEATRIAGGELLGAVVLTARLHDGLGSLTGGISVTRHEEYCVRVARLARRFLGEPDHQLALTAGLLHDIGKVVLATSYPALHGETVEISMREGTTFFECEQRLFKCDHAIVGAHLLAKHRMPPAIVETIAFHHTPSELGGESTLLPAIHAADALVGIVTCGEPLYGLDSAYLRSAGQGARIRGWLGTVEAECVT